MSVICDVFAGLESTNKNDTKARMEIVVVASKGDKPLEGFQHDLALRGIFSSLVRPSDTSYFGDAYTPLSILQIHCI